MNDAGEESFASPGDNHKHSRIARKRRDKFDCHEPRCLDGQRVLNIGRATQFPVAAESACMRTPIAWMFALCCCVAVPAAAQQGRLQRGIPTNAALSHFGYEVAWVGQAVINPARDRVEHVTLDEEMLIVNGTNGVITAFDSENGQRLWAQRLSSFDEPTFPAASNEDLVLAVVGNTMFGIEKLTGDIRWQVRLPGPPSTGPSVDDRQVYLGMLDGSVYSFSLRKIEQLYRERRLPDWSYQAVTWRYQASEEITSPPIPIDGAVNFASRDGSLYSVAKDRRKLNYQFETNAAIVAPMALVGQTQFFGSEDSTFYAINAANGVVLWEFVTGLPLRKAPVALGDALYLMPERGGMFSLDVANGSQRWWHPGLSAFVSQIGDAVVARDLDHNLVVVDRSSGAIYGRIPASHYEWHAVNDRSDRVYLVSSRGQVLAFREAGRDYPIYHRYPERRPILPELAPEEDEADPMAEQPAADNANPFKANE
ncbi:PQQ-binding-like beta-propeller repeat protein [bacterium]|nr:PQQ-binding-like beta-propeller repeat protein [bacterium]